MNWFVDDPTAVGPVIAGSRSRAVGAGVDPFQYEEITGGLASLRDWLPAFDRAARTHQQIAEEAESMARTVTAAASWRAAAVCWHIATTLPNPDAAVMHAAARASSRSLSKYLRLRGGVTELASSIGHASYIGELRLPAGQQHPPVVVIIPGLDSSRAEFLDLADALLARGLAVVAIDGPGQGTLIDQPPTYTYDHVVSAVLNELRELNSVDMGRVAVFGLSLGGLYAQLAAAHDPRITVAATLSGPYPLPTWDSLPPFATDTLRLRTGGTSATERFADQLHHADVVAHITQPLLVVSGTADVLPTPAQAESLAAAAPRGKVHLVPGGDHLCGNARWRWLSATGDWLAAQLQVP